MLPYLFRFELFHHVIALPSFGLMLSIAFSAAYVSSQHMASWFKIKSEHIDKLFFRVLIGSLIGGRLFHVFFEEPHFYVNNPLEILALWEGGLTFYGGVIGALANMLYYNYRHHLSSLVIFDIAAQAAAIGLGIGRIGCFLAGCCWGAPTSMRWGVVFNNPLSFCPLRGIPIHPTQLYEAAAGFFIFTYLYWRSRHLAYKGQMFYHGLFLYAACRFIIEFYRADDYRGLLFGNHLSYSQLISLITMSLIFGIRCITKQNDSH